MQPVEEIQCPPRSRPVSLYDNYKTPDVMSSNTPPPGSLFASPNMIGAMSYIRDCNGTSNVNQSNNNNNISNNNNRVTSAVSTGNVSKIHTAKVKSAVSTGNIERTGRGDNKEKEFGRAPSMANCLSTTVPVNLAACQIAGRHTPTRNSLRHSRMIVMHRTGHCPEKFIPPLVYYRRIALCLATLKTILGIAVISLSLWLLLWAPHLPVEYNPYWSGISLLLSGSFGICLLCCFKKEYPNMSPGYCLSCIKVFSVFLTVVATIACGSAFIFSVAHFSRLKILECTPAQVPNATCICRPRDEPSDSLKGAIRYLDLNCSEVENTLKLLVIISFALNGLGTVLAGLYTYLHWKTRHKRPKYMQVRTNSNSAKNTCRPIYKTNLEETRER
ncbi:uncharacterized protein LOC109858681 isoform X2 [Pseudomyrmex gracilis]|uniref:uncharacterized protein LOC109858681 isoform X2 n=1 Tax=Pseudomyrmex gracilis TaxID=219809 RepID=UPI000994FE53|nr:uncharacterized protein LOC109858681 isoform X2 [Pseudomyrmex gracilis]